MGNTKIAWTTRTWNPATGCTQISPGCDYCYAKRLAGWRWASQYPPVVESFKMGDGTVRPMSRSRVFEDVQEHHDRLKAPFAWSAPSMVFVNSMSDLFHDALNDAFIERVFDTMLRADWHVYQVLTKRPRRMADLVPRIYARLGATEPPSHIWLGVSVELDRYAWRLGYLRATPAAIRFVSCEPLLGPVRIPPIASVDWIIAGGESGGPPERALVERCPGSTCRHPDCGPHAHCLCHRGLAPKPDALAWARSLRDDAQANGTPFFWKQWGGKTSTAGGDLLDGRRWQQWPDGRGGITEDPLGMLLVPDLVTQPTMFSAEAQR